MLLQDPSSTVVLRPRPVVDVVEISDQVVGDDVIDWWGAGIYVQEANQH